MKVYIDQFRVLVVPDMHMTPASIQWGGIGGQDNPLIFSNIRLASGGGMNMIGQTFTDAKIVTHGILFDVDKATLKPESMGTLNQVKRILTQNPALKFEIDGHTDNTGAPPTTSRFLSSVPMRSRRSWSRWESTLHGSRPKDLATPSPSPTTPLRKAKPTTGAWSSCACSGGRERSLRRATG